MRVGYAPCFLLFVAVSLANAQPSAAALTFTVASVKPMVQLPVGGGREGNIRPLKEPGRLRFPAVTLKNLFMLAYDLKDFQLIGPGWIGDERYTFEATMPSDTTEEQTRTMLQNLLKDRFSAQVHRETRSGPTYSLVIGKNGLKIPTPSRAKDNSAATDGFPEIPQEVTGVLVFVINGQAKLTAKQASMGELAAQLERSLGVPVMDGTGLTTKFDFTLRYSSEGLNGPGGRPALTPPRDAAAGLEPLGDIFSALESETGLKLEQKKGPVEVLVIDRVQKVPTDN